METKSLKHWINGVSLTVSFLLPIQLAAQTLSVMPMGDSITQGVRGECGYRRALSQALSKNPQCTVSFVGSRNGSGNNSNMATDVCAAQNTPHESIPGIRADQFLTTIDTRIASYQPDVVLLHVGSNDLYQDQDVESTLSDIHHLLDRVFINKPNATVVVSNVIPWSEESPDPIFYAPFENPNRDMLADTSQLAADITLLVSARATAGDSVEMANVWQDFDSDSMTIDGVHPNPVGEAHIANKMLNALYKLGACGELNPDVQPPITYINAPSEQSTPLLPNPTLSGTALDEGGSGINHVRIAIQNSEGLWLDYTSGTFSTVFDSTIAASMTNTTTSKTDWSIATNLSAGHYRLFALAVDNNNNQVEEAAGNGQPTQNDSVWTDREFEVAATINEIPKSSAESRAKVDEFSSADSFRGGYSPNI